MRRFLEFLVSPHFTSLKGKRDKKGDKNGSFVPLTVLIMVGMSVTIVAVWPWRSWAEISNDLTEEEARQIAFENIQRIVPVSPCLLQETVNPDASGLSVKVLKPEVLKQNGASKMLCFYGRNGALKMLEWESVGETRQQPWVKNRRYLYGKTAQNLGLQEGQLLFVTMKVSDAKSYVFESSGALYATWQKGQCIRASGDVCPK